MILYFHTGKSSFVDGDFRIFQSLGKCNQFSFTVASKKAVPLLFLKQFLFLLRHLPSTRLYVCQFAGYHSFLPALIGKIFDKKCLIISGGTDCVSYPNIGYGNFQKPLLRTFTKWSFQLASHLSPKHESLVYHEYNYDSKEPTAQGIKAFLPNLIKPTTIITNGYDPEKWKPMADRKPNTFITLCGGWQFPFQEELKGIDLILAVAPHFPEYTFAIAGVPKWKKLNIQSKNIELLPPINNNELPAIFSRYEFYMQLSMAEGFPNALCEAMLCGCIPIVSNVFSMPEIIDGNGILLRHRSVEELKSLLQVLRQRNYSPESVRESIAKRYPISKRQSELKQLCIDLMQS